jgi:hypothetical protein
MTNNAYRNVTASVISGLCASFILGTPLPSITITPTQYTTPQFAECSLFKPSITMSSQLMYLNKNGTSNTVLVPTRQNYRVSYENALMLFGEMRALNEDELNEYNIVLSKYFVEVSNSQNFFDIL